MKKLFLMLFMSLFMTSCTSEEDLSENNYNPMVVGEWQIVLQGDYIGSIEDENNVSLLPTNFNSCNEIEYKEIFYDNGSFYKQWSFEDCIFRSTSGTWDTNGGTLNITFEGSNKKSLKIRELTPTRMRTVFGDGGGVISIWNKIEN